ncbi:MAG TPA: anti-sigma factor [Acetobacteraceae bacterium]|jgi:anti-sigma factor RsiW
MACDRYRLLLPALSDRQLGPLRRFLVSRHATHCTACAAELEELDAMRTALRTRLTYHRAPPGLAARIGSTLPREEASAAVAGPRRIMPAWGFAGSGLAGALAGVALTLVLLGGRPAGRDTALQGVIDSQIRARMADHLTDVLTSDQHTVKPWLSERLPVSPPVPELKDVGFPLVGGREDYVDGHPTAVVVYRHAKHVVNLYAWAAPAMADAGFRTSASQGFNVVSWRAGGIAYYAVSDCEADALMQFARDIAQAAPPDR